MSVTRIFEPPQPSRSPQLASVPRHTGWSIERAAHLAGALLGIYAIVFTFLALCQQTHIKRLQEVERLLTIGLLDAESGQRAYLLTGNKIFLAQYRAGLKSLAVYTPVYRSGLVADRSKHLFQDAEIALNLKAEEMALTIRLHDKVSPEAAAAVVNTKIGHGYTETVYQMLQKIRQIETQHVAPFQLWQAPVQIDIHDPGGFSAAALFAKFTSRANMTGLF